MSDLNRIEADITECLRRLRKAHELNDADAEFIFEDALEDLFELRAALTPGRHRAAAKTAPTA